MRANRSVGFLWHRRLSLLSRHPLDFGCERGTTTLVVNKQFGVRGPTTRNGCGTTAGQELRDLRGRLARPSQKRGEPRCEIDTAHFTSLSTHLRIYVAVPRRKSKTWRTH